MACLLIRAAQVVTGHCFPLCFFNTAQMQGKFQMEILPAGHAVQEDVPERVAEVLASFLVRNKFAPPLASFTAAMPAC